MAQVRHLYKSPEPVIAGVCGGLAEFFRIDPTFIRILAVVLTLASFGGAVVVYFFAMIIIPRDPVEETGYIKVTPGECRSQSFSHINASSEQENASIDDSSKQSFTENESCDERSQQSQLSRCDIRKRRNNTARIGVLLVFAGLLAVLSNFVNVSFWRLWPLAIIIIGIIQLFTPAASGWSVERAGSAIVFVSFGILLQALMLRIVSLHSVLLTFWRVWPVFLIILGLIILAGAKKQNLFGLIGSLVLSATLLIGVWLFGDLGNRLTLSLSDGGEIAMEIPSSPLPPEEGSRGLVEEAIGFDPFRLEPERPFWMHPE